VPRHFHDPEDRRAEDIFERMAGDERRARLEEAKVRNAELNRQLEAEEAARREAHRIKTLAHTASIICAEYRAAGVEPIEVNADGVPTVSLATLRWIGWRIEEIDGKRKLVRPGREQRRIDSYDRNT
jgi:hypothetical protein